MADRDPAPRVVLLGPKGCGKTIYRTYLHARRGTELPAYAREALGVAQADWPAEGQVWQRQGADWAWVPEMDLGLRRPRGAYLPIVEPTTFLTRHPLTLPDAGSGGRTLAGFVYDVPGAWWEREEWADAGRTRVTTMIRACGIVVFMLPFWSLLPRVVRRVPQPLALRRLQADGLAAAAALRELEGRHEALRIGSQEWLTVVEQARRGLDRGRGPTLLVTLTMLHREWPLELPPRAGESPAAARVRERLRAVRAVLTHPLLGSGHVSGEDAASRSFDSFRPFEALRLSAVHLWKAACLRGLLQELHDAVSALVAELEAIAVETGDDVLPILQGLRELERSTLGHELRYVAMNVVSERQTRRAAATAPTPVIPLGGMAPSAAAGRRHVHLEPAGAMLPTLYLCGVAGESS